MGQSVNSIFTNIKVRYGACAPQAKEYFMSLRQDRKGSVINLSDEVVNLVGLAHPYFPLEEGYHYVDYCIRGMHYTVLQRHLLTENTSTVADTVAAIEEDLAFGSSERSSCKVAGEQLSSSQMD